MFMSIYEFDKIVSLHTHHGISFLHVYFEILISDKQNAAGAHFNNRHKNR